MKTFLKALLVTTLLFTSILALTLYWSLYRPLPSYTRPVTLPGLNGPVTVIWDEAGVPAIKAENRHDLYYALGYVHARDRLWQITLQQLTIHGRFAEFLGEDLIEADRFLRTLGLAHTSRENLALYSDEEIAILRAYAAGINDYAGQNEGRLPIEFALAGIKPLPYTVEDAIALPRLMAWNLNLVWETKFVVAHLAETRSPEVIGRLLPAAMAREITAHRQQRRIEQEQRRLQETRLPGQEPGQTGHIINRSADNLAAIARLIDTGRQVRQMLNMDVPTAGSNAWAIDGNQTAGGQPILAGDPHLGLSAPSIWYETALSLNGRNVAGVTVPGNPVVFIGRNDHYAWSLTSLMADALDFFVEIPDPLDRGRFVADSTDSGAVLEPFRIRREIIRVKDGDEILHEVKYTRNGPVISDVHEIDLPEEPKISMNWVGNHPGNEIRPGLALNWGDHYQDILDLQQHHTAPALNLIYADQSGNIGHFILGKIPVRRGSALVFRRGWEPDDSWQGYVPENRLPREINPARGWVANANNRVHDDRFPYYISHFWEHPSRYERIREVLGSGEMFDAGSVKRLQNDVFSHHARNIVRYILPVLEDASSDPVIAGVLPYLTNWNYEYDINSTAASVLDAFVMEMSRNLAEEELGEELFPFYMKSMHLPQLVVEEQLSGYATARKDTVAVDTLLNHHITDQTVIDAMRSAIALLQSRYGEEPWQWRWLNPHTVTFSPHLFRDAAMREDAGRTQKLIINNTLSRGPYPAPGHGMSVNNGSYRGNEPFRMHAGPSYRIVADFSRPGYFESILPPGQSGLPLSRHFDDQIEDWLTGGYKRVHFSGEGDEDATYRIQQFRPPVHRDR
jgi:penicillin G amidase